MTDVRERLARFLAAKAIAASDNGERLPDNLWAQKLPLADAILAAFPELTAPDKDMAEGAQEVIGKWMALTPVALNCAQDVAAFATACVAKATERHRAEVERLTRGRDEYHRLMNAQCDQKIAAESALAAAQRRVGVLQNVVGETLAALDKLDPLQAVLPVQQANLRAALAGGTADDGEQVTQHQQNGGTS